MLCPTGRSVQRYNGIVRSTAEWPFGRQSEGVTLILGPHAGPWLDVVLRSSERASCKSGVSSPSLKRP
jgi:hypothetical protein